MKKLIAIFFTIAAMSIPSLVFASIADLSVRAQDIRFSTDTLIAGDVIRIYATVKNVGDVDMSGHVGFYVGSELIGSSQIVTLVAGGEDEEAWIDFTVPSGSFNIRIDLKGTDPQDENSVNNTALSPLYTSIEDQDDDGIEDDLDNCIDISNSNQKDTDSDRIGDVCDTDDDDDGLSDDFENDLGTDSENTDSDNDGIDDAQDYYPNDSSRQEEEAVQEAISEIAEIFSNDDENAIAVDEDIEIEVDETLLARTSGSQLNISSNAAFIYVRDGWKTYEFEALAVDGSYTALAWDFGDGTSSAQKTAVHEFRSAGNYIIRLSEIDNEGNILSDHQEIEISFFHLKNPLVRLVVGALLILLITAILLILRGKNANNKKDVETIERIEDIIEPRKKAVKKNKAKKSPIKTK